MPWHKWLFIYLRPLIPSIEKVQENDRSSHTLARSLYHHDNASVQTRQQRPGVQQAGERT